MKKMLHRCDVSLWPKVAVGNRTNEARKRHENHERSVDRHGLPLSVGTHAANHHEVRLVQLCFDFYMIEAKPENLIGDRAYDSDPLDEELRNNGIEMIAPHRSKSQQAAHARSATAEPLQAALARRALLRLDTMATSHPQSAGSTTLRTSSALSSSPASLSFFSRDFFEMLTQWPICGQAAASARARSPR